MDSNDYRDYLFSAAYVRNRAIWLCVVVLAFTAAERLGLLEGLDPSVPGRAYGAVVFTAVIVAVWVILAVVGLLGLYRWLRS
ncbi:hypothetical protein [Halopiger xanaduensis]|uniref:Uncharacterized protein n=1 Tax=Halopiger xanaduensis (strain DSM 18323 / JCM 14033 / SH-6) TaxID=797210 RepID=F8D7S9_HALXS|nr:hypothetical protein [Halopiger xanaduensis]AEH35532.1 hypothetical protein Halxa_0895 [Halopiger xanaduensis SH-6]